MRKTRRISVAAPPAPDHRVDSVGDKRHLGICRPSADFISNCSAASFETPLLPTVGMPRQEDWKREARDAVLGEGWTPTGPNRIVKVVGIKRPPAASQGGFVTLERYLVGLTPYQMQRALGLQLGDLKGGCVIYRFKRLPAVGEYSNELTAEFP